MAYHRIDSRFWIDEKSSAWTDDEKLLALYLKTNPHATTEGFYWLPQEYICTDLGWSMERLGTPFATLCRDGYLSYDKQAKVLLIRNALKYQAPENPGQAKAAMDRIAALPETPLLKDFLQCATRYSTRLATLLRGLYGTPSQDCVDPHTHTQPHTQSLSLTQKEEDAHTREQEKETPSAAEARFLEQAKAARESIGKDIPLEIRTQAQEETARDRRRT